ncbi:SDR family oxidoreductase [Sutterella sp.]|uniref:SDR family NAD(P)-dependent oxidoreductase n=1 Tax=Sutterella sp. TaxID=1981025 RepID=UPI0026E09048|nr:SDR family NAD(P)-dependent oxidoreductase [Sutterella sp.]MDO5531766.1 SDR family NAD(P)-dependent oxidoreductase [Sutterella sp.]
MTEKLQPRTIAILGATGGIGQALARACTGEGTTLFLSGRSADALACTASECRSAGARVYTAAFDIRDREAALAWVAEVCTERIPDTVILTAGVSASVRDADGITLPEAQSDLAREMDVNASGVILCANAFAEKALREGRSHMQIGLIASLAALTGLPSSPGYSASKAALLTYGQALRRLARGTSVGVTVVLPGFVTSPMSARYLGSKPFEISADRAARLVLEGLEKNVAVLAFPKLLALGIRALEVLPECLQNVFLKLFDFRVEADREAREETGRIVR